MNEAENDNLDDTVWHLGNCVSDTSYVNPEFLLSVISEIERRRAEVARLHQAADVLAKDAAAAKIAVSIEREACAKVAEHLNGWGHPPAPDLAQHIASVIRARGTS